MPSLYELCRRAGYCPASELNQGHLSDRTTRLAKGVLIEAPFDFEAVYLKETPARGVAIFYFRKDEVLYFCLPTRVAINNAERITRKNTNMSFEKEIPKENLQRLRHYVEAWLNLDVLEPNKRDKNALELLVTQSN